MLTKVLGKPSAVVALAAVLGGCSAGVASPAMAPAPSLAPRATEVDIEFLVGMIHHHSQAIEMAGLAEPNDAGGQVQVLAERIAVSQVDEIALMELWLRDHGVEPPVVGPTLMPAGMDHDHSGHAMMPGMATPEQMSNLAAARGEAFDRLFLTLMIQHHQGALQMVDALFSTDGGGVDDTIYKFASDTFADQGSEIDRMQRMLDSMNGR